MLRRIADDDLLQQQESSATKLRPRYEKLLRSMNDAARPFAPLFTDFLLLPSVVALWTPGATVDDATWAAQLALIQEELDDYRLELALHARQVILAATTGNAPENQEDDFESEGLDNDFFEFATSFVCCSVAGCPTKVAPTSQRRRGSWWDSQYAPAPITANRWEGWVGPLVEVLEHQHRIHNGASELPVKAVKSAYPPFRVSVPLEVACGIESLLEMHNLESSKAKKRHLDLASKKIEGYEWVNSGTTQRYYRGEGAWSTLVRSCLFCIVNLPLPPPPPRLRN